MRRYLVSLTALLCASSALAQCVISDFEERDVGTNAIVVFRQPSFSGSTSSFLASTAACNIPRGVYNCSVISDEQAVSGTRSLKVAWQFRLDPQTNAPYPNAWLRLTTFRITGAIKPNPEIDFDHKVRLRLYVPSTTPDFYLTLGVRETGTIVGCGNDGGTTGGIEWIGATGERSPQAAPIGKLINQKDQWLTIVFDIRNEPILRFAGATANGRLDTNTGTLEQLAFTPVDPAQLGPYIVYIDDVETIAQPAIPGDVNGDRCVNDQDLLLILLNFGNPGQGDVNNDGTVNDQDLLIVLLNFGQGC
ncbi:MAG: hypothetical protein NZ874_00370 [Fimbriimonadales bacterium]|nr:hypothetical protein [Fimbriimonadales bacterium]